MFKRIILFILLTISISAMSPKEKEIIKKNDILKNYTGKILIYGEYEN